ncbi:Myb/SANT-like domain-containing protein [Cinnamomum micranthum f. kanehirae]|uniref:Myb/SANT-like domain-containing protein n=1 Tax=Cinnamomum micranthum f. kanehirae TaxID=337451 RepID=A0A3S3N5S6_9MAGN|nr:Myb/SANT-like domain-containing protein [Cinnamomum micranthum f. kanehirae]
MSAPNCVGQRLKAYWNPQHHQVFVELCVEQVQKGNRPTHLFNRAGQVKNHYDSTKESWKAWKALIGKSRMGFDHVFRTITAPYEAWASYIQANPKAAQFRTRPLEFEDELDIIFGGTTATGDYAWAPSSGVLHNNVVDITRDTQDPVSTQV